MNRVYTKFGVQRWISSKLGATFKTLMFSLYFSSQSILNLNKILERENSWGRKTNSSNFEVKIIRKKGEIEGETIASLVNIAIFKILYSLSYQLICFSRFFLPGNNWVFVVLESLLILEPQPHDSFRLIASIELSM